MKHPNPAPSLHNRSAFDILGWALEPGDVVDVEIERLGPVTLTYSDR